MDLKLKELEHPNNIISIDEFNLIFVEKIKYFEIDKRTMQSDIKSVKEYSNKWALRTQKNSEDIAKISMPVSFSAAKRKQPIYPSERLDKTNESIKNEEEVVSTKQDSSTKLIEEQV